MKKNNWLGFLGKYNERNAGLFFCVNIGQHARTKNL